VKQIIAEVVTGGNQIDSTIEKDTALKPKALADKVVKSWMEWLQKTNPSVFKKAQAKQEEMAKHLATRADVVYRGNPPFRVKIQANGGGNALCKYMANWLHAMMLQSFNITDKVPDKLAGLSAYD